MIPNFANLFDDLFDQMISKNLIYIESDTMGEKRYTFTDNAMSLLLINADWHFCSVYNHNYYAMWLPYSESLTNCAHWEYFRLSKTDPESKLAEMNKRIKYLCDYFHIYLNDMNDFVNLDDIVF